MKKVTLIGLTLLMFCCNIYVVQAKEIRGQVEVTVEEEPETVRRIGDQYRYRTTHATIYLLYNTDVIRKNVVMAMEKQPSINDNSKVWLDWITTYSFALRELFVYVIQDTNYCEEIDVLTKQGILVGVEHYVRHNPDSKSRELIL